MAGPVYSAVGLPGSRGKRGCVQGLINHGCLGGDKQAGPSRDAAALPLLRGQEECTACGETRGRPELGGDEQELTLRGETP